LIVEALDVVVNGCANPFEPTVRSLRYCAVRVRDEISWATAALGVPEADLVVSMTLARLEEAENTACRGRSHVDMCSHLAPATAIAGIPNGDPPEALCVTDRVRANLVPGS
jgi:hypothetical protein